MLSIKLENKFSFIVRHWDLSKRFYKIQLQAIVFWEQYIVFWSQDIVFWEQVIVLWEQDYVLGT